MPLKMKGVVIHGGKIGVEAPSEADVEITDSIFHGTERPVLITDVPAIIQYLRLRPDTPANDIAKALVAIRNSQSRQEAEAIVASSRLSSWLSAGANITTLTDGLARLYTSNALPNILAALKAYAGG